MRRRPVWKPGSVAAPLDPPRGALPDRVAVAPMENASETTGLDITTAIVAGYAALVATLAENDDSIALSDLRLPASS